MSERSITVAGTTFAPAATEEFRRDCRVIRPAPIYATAEECLADGWLGAYGPAHHVKLDLTWVFGWIPLDLAD